MLDGIYAAFSPGLPSEWTSSAVELVVTEAVANGATLKSEATIRGNIVLVSFEHLIEFVKHLEFEKVESHRDVKAGDRLRIMHDQDEFKQLVNSTRGASDWDSARHPLLCGEAGVVTTVDSDNTLMLMIDGQDEEDENTPWIPVNACSLRPLSVNTALVEHAEEKGAVAFIVVSTDETIFQMTGPDKDPGYKSSIPVLMIKSSDAVRLREQGSALIRDKGAPCPCFRDHVAQANPAIESA